MRFSCLIQNKTVWRDPCTIRRYLSTRTKEDPGDIIFKKFVIKNTELMSVGKFLAALSLSGLKETDPRLSGLAVNLKKLYKRPNSRGDSPSTLELSKEEFKEAIASTMPLIYRALKNDFIIPDFSEFTKYIEEYYWMCQANNEGKVADYIPQLAKVNPKYWGVSVCTVDGQMFSLGDTNVPFTLQSTSKPLTYGIALDQLTQEIVHQYIGQEPSGRNFNEIVLDHNMRPHNPMVNAGAIVVCSLIKNLVYPELTLGETFNSTMNYFKRMAGGESIGFNNSVYLSEKQAANRNYALGFYMRENRCFPENTNFKEIMDFYFQCCSMEADCEAVAVMAATLANGGFCPTTDDKVLRSDAVRDVLSLMHSCGMYDYSGQFAFKVGLPAKSGVSGAMMLVIPNVMGICTWSPPLDEHGNSVRGIQFCESGGSKLLALLVHHHPMTEKLMNVLVHNTQLSEPELVRAFHAFKYNDKLETKMKPSGQLDYESIDFTTVNLLLSASKGDISQLRMHWLSGTDLSKPDQHGRTALHLAAAEGHLDCVRFLLKKCKVPFDVKDKWGKTPLSEAQSNNRTQIVKFISQWSKKIEIPTKHSDSTNESSTKEIPSTPDVGEK